MPPRRRRTGYRPGALSDELRTAIAAEAQQLAQIETLVGRIDGVADVIAAVEGALDGVRAVRLDAIAQLRRAGWSYDRIAAVSSMSKSRVKQLVVEAEQQGFLPARGPRRVARRTRGEDELPPALDE